MSGRPFSNQLTPGEAERLAILAEECGEVVQAVGKVLRHGFSSMHPAGLDTNRSSLERELGDLMAAAELMITAMDVDPMAISTARMAKQRKLRLWTHHQRGVL